MSKILLWQNWVKDTLKHVSLDDPDRANDRNGVGFSKYDGEIGHSISSQLQSGKFLSPAQWRVAGQLAQRYRKQSPIAMPEKPDAIEMDEALIAQRGMTALLAAENYIRIKLEDGCLCTEAQGRIPRELFGSLTSLLKSLKFRFSPKIASWLLPGRLIDDGEGVLTCLQSQSGIRIDAAAVTFLHALKTPEKLPDYIPYYHPSLWEYQKEGVEWLHRQKQCWLADSMGLGKTVMVLCSIDSRYPVLILAPKAAKAVWIREAAHWRPELKISQIKTTKDFRFPEPGEILVCNYEQLPRLRAEDPENSNTMQSQLAYNMRPGTILIADESQALKNTVSYRSKRFRVMSKSIIGTGGRVWMLSGTPILNRQMELWGGLFAMNAEKHVFPQGWKQFVEECDGQPGRFGLEWGTRINPCVPIKIKEIMLRRTRDDVFSQTPEKIREFYPVEVTPAFRKKLDDLWMQLGHVPEDPENFLDEVLGRGIHFDQISRLRRELSEIKTAVLMELVSDLEEVGEPFCVASAHRLPVDLLGQRDGWAAITGDTSANERGRIQDRFQEGELKGVAFTIKAGGVGISLNKGTNRMIFVDLEWTPSLNAQAEDRLRPHLQKSSCIYTILQLEHPLEKRINAALIYKASLIGQFYKGESK